MFKVLSLQLSSSMSFAVLDLTVQLIEIDFESEVLHSLVVFLLQYVFLNHRHWKYEVKHVRWTVTLKVRGTRVSCWQI